MRKPHALPVLIAAVLIMAALARPANAQGGAGGPSWEGAYFTLLLGPAWTGMDVDMPPMSSSDSYASITGGGAIGYNWLLPGGSYLVGLEGDITFADLGGDFSLDRHKASLVGRLGVFVKPDCLLFGVLGIAGGQYSADIAVTNTTMTVIIDGETEETITIVNTTTRQASKDQRIWGLTLGGGFEKTVKSLPFPARFGLEYRFTDFDKWDFNTLGQDFAVEPQIHEARFRFVVPF